MQYSLKPDALSIYNITLSHKKNKSIKVSERRSLITPLGESMEISVGVGSDSISIAVENPFHINLDSVVGQIVEFCSLKGAALNSVDVRGLIPQMVRGIAGC
ncbi:MAG: hypothetical protein COZ31_09790, partial [Nitrospirae bacterium CG_4_10_14_3_um_filter_44_29]